MPKDLAGVVPIGPSSIKVKVDKIVEVLGVVKSTAHVTFKG